MKPNIRDYLAIVAALLAIFLCGYGIGFLFGERKAMSRVPTPPAHTSINWEDDTLATLRESIDLTPEQNDAIKSEIALSGQQVQTARQQALDAYRRELSDLNQRLKSHLSPEQWDRLQSPPAPKE